MSKQPKVRTALDLAGGVHGWTSAYNFLKYHNMVEPYFEIRQTESEIVDYKGTRHKKTKGLYSIDQESAKRFRNDIIKFLKEKATMGSKYTYVKAMVKNIEEWLNLEPGLEEEKINPFTETIYSYYSGRLTLAPAPNKEKLYAVFTPYIKRDVDLKEKVEKIFMVTDEHLLPEEDQNPILLDLGYRDLDAEDLLKTLVFNRLSRVLKPAKEGEEGISYEGVGNFKESWSYAQVSTPQEIESLYHEAPAVFIVERRRGEVKSMYLSVKCSTDETVKWLVYGNWTNVDADPEDPAAFSEVFRPMSFTHFATLDTNKPFDDDMQELDYDTLKRSVSKIKDDSDRAYCNSLVEDKITYYFPSISWIEEREF